jgi:hypothetical protein
MAAPVKALFDLNVILDVLQKREPFWADSALALACAETRRVQGFIAPHSLTTLFYLVAKDQSPAVARVSLTSLMQFLSVAPVDGTTMEQALNLPYRDFEDAVLMMAAVQCKADYLVTRNGRDFQPAMVPVIQPAELVVLVS